MYSRVLVPLDGSSLSERVLPQAQHLAESFNAQINLVYAVPHGGDEIPGKITDEVRGEGESYLQRIADSLPAELKPSCVVKAGQPAEVILKQAEAQEGTIITMATHGYSGVQRVLLGSIAHKVVQAANMPVLLIPAGARSPDGGPVKLEKVVVPLDGSPLAEQVLPIVVSLCKTLNMELVLLRAYHPNFPGSTIRMREVSKIVRESAEIYIKSKAEELEGEGLERVSYAALRGIPAQQITDFAIEAPNSITAMCTHGRHGVGRWLLGSVTEAVIHSSQEPVLVIRGGTRQSVSARTDTGDLRTPRPELSRFPA